MSHKEHLAYLRSREGKLTGNRLRKAEYQIMGKTGILGERELQRYEEWRELILGDPELRQKVSPSDLPLADPTREDYERARSLCSEHQPIQQKLEEAVSSTPDPHIVLHSVADILDAGRY
jgi:hypothetical protein